MYERVGILLIKAYERVGKCVISVCKRTKKCEQMHFMYVKDARKLSGLVIYWYLKDGTLNAVKRDAVF